MSVLSFDYSHWQIAGSNQDDPVCGVDDINLCIENILITRKGTDILRPQFGCNHFDYIDQPSDVAIPNMVREIYSALVEWEKRIVIEKVQIFGEAPHFELTVFYHLTNETHREIYKTTVKT